MYPTRTVGRRRQTRLDLPPRMHAKGETYYHVSNTKPRKWTPLGSDLARARLKWAELENMPILAGSVEALINRFEASSMDGYAEATKYTYKRHFVQLRKVFGAMRPDDVTPQHIARYLDIHPKKVLANHQIAALGTVFEKGMRWGLMRTNPCKGIRKNPEQARRRYLTDDELAKVREQGNDVLRIAIDLAYLTGMRQGDICRIKLGDCREDGIFLEQQKTGKRQVFLWNDDLRSVIAAAKALPRPIRGLHALCTRRGAPYSPKTIQWLWREAAKVAGVPDAHFHDIRGKAATDAKAQGMDYQRLLGHANKAMSDRYVKIREAEPVQALKLRR